MKNKDTFFIQCRSLKIFFSENNNSWQALLSWLQKMTTLSYFSLVTLLKGKLQWKLFYMGQKRYQEIDLHTVLNLWCFIFFLILMDFVLWKKKLLQGLKTIDVASPYPWGARCKELIAESSYCTSRLTMADTFPAFLLETGSEIYCGKRPPPVSWQLKWAYCYQFVWNVAGSFFPLLIQ